MTASLSLRSVDLLPDPSGDGLLLRIVDDRLRVGWGEAVARPGFSRPLAELMSAASSLPSALQGRSLRSVEDADELSAELRAADDRPLPSPLRFAVESALLDLLGQAKEVPVAELLAEPAPRLRRNALVYAGAETERLTALRQLGFSTFKVKARGPWPGSLRDLQAFSRALGEAGEAGEAGESEPLRLRIDCNGSIPREHASTLLAGLAALSPEYVEEPIAGLEAASWRDLARPGLRLAVDESAVDELSWRAHLEVAAAEIVVIKPAFVGGLFAALRRVREARARGLQVVITSALEGPIGTAAAAHLALAIRPSLAVGITARSGAALPEWLNPEAPTIDHPRAAGLGLSAALPSDAARLSRTIGARR